MNVFSHTAQRTCGALAIVISVMLRPAPLSAQEVTPSHNFRLITKVVDDLNSIRAAQRITTPIMAIPRDGRKTPTHVYAQVYLLLETLKELTEKPNYTFHHPIRLPNKKTERMLPSDVFVLLQQVRRITKTLRVATNVEEPDTEFAILPGRTPPDVDRLVRKAIALVETLL